jgi:hypothetical protein
MRITGTGGGGGGGGKRLMGWEGGNCRFTGVTTPRALAGFPPEAECYTYHGELGFGVAHCHGLPVHFGLVREKRRLGIITHTTCNSGPLICITWRNTGIQWGNKWETRWNRYNTTGSQGRV